MGYPVPLGEVQALTSPHCTAFLGRWGSHCTNQGTEAGGGVTCQLVEFSFLPSLSVTALHRELVRSAAAPVGIGTSTVSALQEQGFPGGDAGE